ncbi:MAG: DUF1302 family protein [bacterium]|nr:DUF1302 family protein [bacterium]
MFVPSVARAETEIFGRLKLEGAYETKADKMQKSEQSIDLEIKSYLGENISLKALFRGIYETRLEEDILSEGEVRELYADISGERYKLRLGRQQVVWGKTDGLRLLDLVNPQDLREFILDDFIDSRVPLWMARGDIYVGDDTLQLLLIPDYKPNDIADSGDRFEPVFLQAMRAAPIPYDEEDEPGVRLENSEYGFRYNGFVGGWDYSLNYFNSWDDNPLYFKDPATGGIERRYRRYSMAGGSFSNAFGSLVVRGELAYNGGRYFSTADPLDSDGLVRKDEAKGALGLDYTVGDWLISGQIFESCILDYDDEIVFDESTTNISFLVNVKFLNETLDVKLLNIYGVNDSDGMNRLSLTYAVTDAWKLMAGGTVFSGPADSFMGQFDDADRVEMELTYSY